MVSRGREHGERTPGIDKATVASIENGIGVGAFLEEIRGLLKSGEFRPVPVRQVMIPKKSGKLPSSGYQRRRHSAVASSELSGSVLITHPFHPLSGQRLEVLFAKRRAGAVVLVGESAELGRVTVQESWTDRGPAPLGCRVSAEGLAALDTLIRSLRGR